MIKQQKAWRVMLLLALPLTIAIGLLPWRSGSAEPSVTPPPNTPDVRAAFEADYLEFKAYCDSVAFSSDSRTRLNSPQYKAIVALGPAAVPLIVEKLQADPSFIWLAWACTGITKVSGDPTVNPWAKETKLEWWTGGQKRVNERFELVYKLWEDAQTRGEAKGAEKLRKTLRGLGIAAIPLMIEKAKAGDEALLPLVKELTNGAANVSGEKPEQRIASAAAWWNNHRKEWLISFPDQESLTPPTPETAPVPETAAPPEAGK